MTVDTLWFTRCPAPSAASIAIREGWLTEEFAADGIAVRSLASSSDKAVQLSHYRHTQPNSFRFGGYVPPLVALSRGGDLKILGLSAPDRAAAVLALPASGIRRPEDLRGKRLSVPCRVNDGIDWWRATVLDGYDRALALAGLTPGNVELVEVAIQREFVDDAMQGQEAAQSLWGARSQFAVQREEAAALIRGEVDVIYSDAAMGALIIAFLGLVPVVALDAAEDGASPEEAYPVVLTASASLVAERPDLVERWVFRLLDAPAWAAANEADAVRILARDTGVPEDLFAPGYSARAHRQLDIDLSQARVAMLERRLRQLERHGFLAAPYDLSGAIDPAPLAAAQARRAAASRSAAA